MIFAEERIGKTFGKLTILDTEISLGKRRYFVLCACGNQYKTCFATMLKNKNGCVLCRNKTSRPPSQVTHKKSKSKEYKTWTAMKARCVGSGKIKYKNYGGRGITMDPSWDNFEQFYADMGEAPSNLHSIDRINNNEGYSKSNCRWATKIEQAQNRRSNINIKINDLILCKKEWLQRIGIKKSIVSYRMNRLKWSLRDALFTPVYKVPSQEYTSHIKTFEIVK